MSKQADEEIQKQLIPLLPVEYNLYKGRNGHPDKLEMLTEPRESTIKPIMKFINHLVEQRCLEARIDEVNLHLFDPTDVAYPGIPCDHSAEVLNARLESLETELANLKQAQNKEK